MTVPGPGPGKSFELSCETIDSSIQTEFLEARHTEHSNDEAEEATPETANSSVPSDEANEIHMETGDASFESDPLSDLVESDDLPKGISSGPCGQCRIQKKGVSQASSLCQLQTA